MQITTPTGTYKWIGDKWGCTPLWGYIIQLGTDGTINFQVNGALIYLETRHTPEQLVKLGYMELIETKPEEKPQFDDSQLLIGRNTYNPFNNEWKEIPEEKPTDWYGIPFQRIFPQPDHDKAMEIPEVPSFFSSELSKEHNEWNHKVRDTLNLITKKINNL